MNICVFSIVTYWHGIGGGMHLYGKHLLENLSERGHKIIVISTKHPYGKEYEEINSIKIHYLKYTTFGSPRKGWKKQSISTFKEIAKKEAIDIVLSQTIAGYGVVKIARRMEIPFITIMHGYEAMVFWSTLNQVLNLKTGYSCLFRSFFSSVYCSFFQEIPILMKSSLVIAVSDMVATYIEKRLFINRDKIKVINYGIDLNVFKFSEEERECTRLKLKIPDDNQVILFLSILLKQKGADIAIRAFNELARSNKNLKLIIAGDGEYIEDAKLLVKDFKLKPNVIFTGLVHNKDASQYYNASDIFVFPTLRLESFGIVIAEAMACGKPVIASNIGSIPRVIDDGVNGVLFSPGEFQELAKQISLLLNDQQYSKILAKNARQKAYEKFGLDRMVKETLKVFESAMIRKKGQE